MMRGRAVVRGWSVRAAVLAAGLALAGQALAQAFPNKPVRWIVPFPPGGPTDVVARVVGPKLGERLGQPVIIENRPGAGGNVGTDLVAKGPADGYAMLMVIPGLVTNPYFFRNSPDPKDLQSIVQLSSVSLVLIAHPEFPAKNTAEVIAQIKANPGRVSCGTSGSLPTVGCELLRAHAGDILRVQYKGNAPALNALIAGEINLLFDVVNTALPQVRGGKARAIASTNLKRGTGPFAELPTVAETIPDFDLVSWQGLMVARGTPADIVQRLNRDANAVLADADVRKRLSDTGLEVAGGTAEAFDNLIRRDFERFGKALRDAGVKPE